MVFEDAVAGIGAANAAGMTSIGIGEKEVLVAAKYNVDQFKEIDVPFVQDLIAIIMENTGQ